VGRALTLGWGLATLAGSLAGILVAPKVLLSPNAMDTVLVFGFTAAILGGLDSPVGAVVGAVITGLALSYVGGYFGSSLETLGAFVILGVVLMLRPEGLFGRIQARAETGAAPIPHTPPAAVGLAAAQASTARLGGMLARLPRR